MEVVETGYKMTEVGLIPIDWSCPSISEICTLRHGFQFLDHHFSRTGVGVVKIGNMIDGAGINESNLTFVPVSVAEQLKKVELNKGDVLMALTGGTLGKVSIVDVNRPLLQNYRVGNFFPKHGLDRNYLYQILTSFYLQRAVDRLVNEAAQPNFGKQDFDKLYIPLPPTLQEQKAIATALSDVDALISSLDKVIEKKKAIKQGAMQELLTPPDQGGKRLEGFSGEWDSVNLGDITSIQTGKMNNQDKEEDGIYPFFVRSQTVERINRYSYDEEAILVPGEGNIGRIFHHIIGKFEVHQRVYRIHNFHERFSGRFIYYMLVDGFYDHAMTNTVKATVDSLRLPTFQNFPLCIPNTLNEQLAIIEILDDIQHEIRELKIKRDKYNQIKQGMMQELLTGKTRLI